MRKLAYVFTMVFFIASSCNTDTFTKSDPKDVLIKFFEAISRKDIPTARTLATKDSETMLNLLEMGMKMAPDSVRSKIMDRSRFQFENAVVSGDDATVAVKDKQSKEGTSFNLKKESGSWKVAFDLTTMMQMGQNKMREKGFDQKKIDKIMDDVKGQIDSNQDLKKILGDTPK